jgi:hypothetical protein
VLEVDDSLVPIGVSGQSEDRTFVGSAGQAKAVIQISGLNFPIGCRQCSVKSRPPRPAMWRSDRMILGAGHPPFVFAGNDPLLPLG